MGRLTPQGPSGITRARTVVAVVIVVTAALTGCGQTSSQPFVKATDTSGSVTRAQESQLRASLGPALRKPEAKVLLEVSGKGSAILTPVTFPTSYVEIDVACLGTGRATVTARNEALGELPPPIGGGQCTSPSGTAVQGSGSTTSVVIASLGAQGAISRVTKGTRMQFEVKVPAGSVWIVRIAAATSGVIGGGS